MQPAFIIVIRFRLKVPKQRVYGDFYFFNQTQINQIFRYIAPVSVNLKKELHDHCLRHVVQRMEAAQQAINDAQQAASDDTKSSAGDKYETGREMMSQETERNLKQLNEANKLKVALNAINPLLGNDRADPGSLVITNNGNFYLSISAGLISIDGKNYFAVSPASPIGLQLKGLKKGQEFKLNNKNYLIENIL